MLLPTIISRCQNIPFVPLPFEVAAAIIKEKCPEINSENAYMLALLSGGCPGKVLEIETEGVFEIYQSFVDEIIKGYTTENARVESLLAFSMQLSQHKETLPTLMQLFKLFYTDIMKYHAGVPIHSVSADNAELLRERWNLEQLSAKMAAIDTAEKALSRNCNRGLVCDVLMQDLL